MKRLDPSIVGPRVDSYVTFIENKASVSKDVLAQHLLAHSRNVQYEFGMYFQFNAMLYSTICIICLFHF